MIDWSKPIQFANGEPAVLYCMNATNFKAKPYAVLRPNERVMECAMWFYPEDGTGPREEYRIVNVP
jgi:hypothetical protein